MVNVPKREDGLLDALLEYQAQIRHARRLIAKFTIADPTLWPILSEIDRVLDKVNKRD